MTVTLKKREIIKTLRSHAFTKELKDFEFEVKFDISAMRAKSLAVLKIIREHTKNKPQYIFSYVPRGDIFSAKVSFFANKSCEYSSFSYHGAKMVKIKKHKILHGRPFSIFKNSEELVIDRDGYRALMPKYRQRFKRHKHRLANLELFSKAYVLPAKYFGDMVKERVKDFVLDTRDGRIYTVSVSYCTSKGRIQKQLEVEYAGFIRGLGRRAMNKEKEILKGLKNLSLLIYASNRAILRPSVERKFTFVKRS